MMTKLKKSLFGIFILLVVLAVAFHWYKSFAGSVEQPLEYSHKVHTELLTCQDCHKGVIDSAYATLPDIEVCMGCHQGDPISDSPEEKKLINYIKNNKDIVWKRLYEVPVHVYFSHARHISVGKLECTQCHGNMGETTQPPRRALVSLGMSDCMDCHKKNQVDLSCITCHK